MEIDVQYALPGSCAPDAALIRRWASMALADRREDVEVTVRIVDREEIASLNETYRHCPGTTNVLSFPIQAPAGIESTLLGDIVICAPVVNAEALEQDKTPDAHWAHMVIHGMLHLLGYDHMNETDARKMEFLETELLGKLGYPDPWNGVTVLDKGEMNHP